MQLAFIEHLPCAWQCAKLFVCTASFVFTMIRGSETILTLEVRKMRLIELKQLNQGNTMSLSESDSGSSPGCLLRSLL